MKRPGTAAAAPGLPDADAAPEPARVRALRALALPLVALVARLQEATAAEPAALRNSLAAAVSRFEADARGAGVPESGIAGASYLLCAWAEEQFASAPWGAQGAGLLKRFHGDGASGDKLLPLLTRVAEKPGEHRALLELFHTCLSLGLRAGLVPGSPDHEMLRSRVYLALRQVAPAPALAAPWHCAAAAANPPRTPRVAVTAVLLLGVLALAGYTASHVQLAARVDSVLASLQHFMPPRSARPPVAGTAAPPRLASRLGEDLRAGRLAVRDEPLRSVVVVRAETLEDAGEPLTRVGSALARLPGKILVVGYTDGSDPPTARTPSAWHQAMDWARATADVLRPQVGEARLAVEARVDAGARESPRRVEIVLFPQ